MTGDDAPHVIVQLKDPMWCRLAGLKSHRRDETIQSRNTRGTPLDIHPKFSLGLHGAQNTLQTTLAFHLCRQPC